MRYLAIIAVLAVSAPLMACGGSDASNESASASASSSSCTPKHTFPTITKGTLTVSSVDYPPFLVVKDDTLSGVAGVLIHDVAKMECLKVKLVTTTANGLVPSVVSGRADISAAYAWRTKKRTKVVNLSAPLYLSNLYLVSKHGTVKTVADLEGKRVGAASGQVFNDALAKIPGIDLKLYENEKEWLQDIEVGRLDAAMDGAGGQYWLKSLGYDDIQYVKAPPSKLVPSTLKPAQIGWPMTKDNEQMLHAINDDIAEMHKDGTIARALKKFGLDPNQAKVGKPFLL